MSVCLWHCRFQTDGNKRFDVKIYNQAVRKLRGHRQRDRPIDIEVKPITPPNLFVSGV